MAVVTPQFVTVEPALGLAEEDSCTLQINIMYEVVPSIVCSVCLSFGLIYCFFGYRCLKVVLFFSGFLFGSAAVLLLYHKEPALDSHLSLETRAGIGLGVGVLCGLVAMLVSAVGYILSGLQLGALTCLALLVPAGQFWVLSSEWVPVGSMLALGIITAVFTLLWHKLFMVLYTCVYGAVTVMLCLDYVIGTFAMPEQVYGLLRHGVGRPLCWFDWAVAGIWPLLSLVGGLVQWRWTARELLQKEAHQKKKKEHVLKHRHFVQGGRRPHRKRRPLPLKRYASDVLAPSYIQSLQERRMGTSSSCSSVSTITHTLIDFDFETGSMVPLTACSPVFAV
ncbi:transmembrane protein 198-like [Eucyclogobius newberryi]|uniref:transmembrane protein 198-like n=1 Tax=Eucyclogobius newberryi TaxID=166745 RepID=UPI003B5A6EF6